MTRRARVSPGWLALLALTAAPVFRQGDSSAVLAQRPASRAEPVTITLLAEAVVDDSLVALDQIAKLSGGPDAVRKRLAQLDVAEFKLGAAHTTVLSDQVRFRLLLAGLDASQFDLRGARRTIVLESDEPATLRRILGAADSALRTRFAGADNVTLTPSRAVEVPAVELRSGEHVRFEAKVKGPVPAAAGRVLVEVGLVVNGKRREVVPVFFEVAENEPAPARLGAERPGIRTALYTAPAPVGRAVLIKARDSVKVIAIIGAARIEALGEALQDGRAGEVIGVRNVESGRTVHGRVQAGGTVLVDY